MLLLDMAYRLLREFRQASTRLDTPPLSNRRHPGSDIAQLRARTLSGQQGEAALAVSVLNRMTRTAKPVSVRVA